MPPEASEKKALRGSGVEGVDDAGFGGEADPVDPMQWDSTAVCVWIKGQGLDNMIAQVNPEHNSTQKNTSHRCLVLRQKT